MAKVTTWQIDTSHSSVEFAVTHEAVQQEATGKAVA